MELPRCHVSVVQTPFAACGIHMHHLGTPKSATPIKHITPEEPKSNVGIRGIRQLALKHRKDSDEESLVLKDLQSNDITGIPLRFFTLHKKGQLLVWNGLTSDLIRSCSHGRNYVVQHCVHSDQFIFTTVESLEDDESEQGGPFKVFQWDASTLKICNTLLIEGKIETIALASDTVLLIGTETSIEMYEFNKTSYSHLHSFKTRERNGEVLNIPRKIEVVEDFLLVAGSTVQLTVWSLQTKAKIASSFVDLAESSTCMQVLSSPSGVNRKRTAPRRSSDVIHTSHPNTNATASSPPPFIVLTGTTDGNIMIWSLPRPHASTVSPFRPPRKSIGAAPQEPHPPEMKNEAEMEKSFENRRVSTLPTVASPSRQGNSNSLSVTLSNQNGGPKKLIVVEKQNLHHTRVVAVLADNDIIVSADDYSGVMVMHRRDRLLTPLSHIPTRAMMLDEDNKRILLGDDMGTITVFSYSGYASRSQKIETLFTCRPHNGPISGLYLQLGNGNDWERVMSCSLEGSIATLDFSEEKSLMVLEKEVQEDYDLHNLVSVFKALETSAPKDEPVTTVVAVMEPKGKLVRFLQPNFTSHSDFPTLSLKEIGKIGDTVVKGIEWVSEKVIVVMFPSQVKVFQCVTLKDGALVWTEVGEWFFESSFHRNGHPPLLLDVEVTPDHTILLIGRDDPKALGGHSAFPGTGFVVLLRLEGDHFLHCVYCRHMRCLPRRGRYLFSAPLSGTGSGNTNTDAVSSMVYYVGVQVEKGGMEVVAVSVEQSPKQSEITSDMAEPFLSKYCTDSFALLESQVGAGVALRVAYLDGGNAYCADVGPNLSGLTTHVAFLKGVTATTTVSNSRASLKSNADLRSTPLTGSSFNDPGRIIGWCIPRFGSVLAVVLREKSNRADVILEDGSIGHYLTYDGDYAPVDPGPRRRSFHFPSISSSSGGMSVSASYSGFRDMPTSPSSTPATPAVGVSSCSIASSKEGRYVAVGYSDGLVQVFDICERRLICRWFTPHVGKDMRIRALSNGVLVTSGSSSVTSLYMIPCHFVYDEDNAVPQ